MLTHRIRLDPNNKQRSQLLRYAGVARFAYNWGLARWKELWLAGAKPTWMSLNAELNKRKRSEFSWMRGVPWRIPNAALEDLGHAFISFFKRCKKASVAKKGYPHFKSKRKTTPSFCIDGRAITTSGKKIKIPTLGWFRMMEPLRFPGRILFARFKELGGYWFVSLCVEIDESKWSYSHHCETQAVIGVDLGVKDLATLSNGTRIAAPRVLRRYEQALRRCNKALSRRTAGGKNWKEAKAKLSALHRRITSIRRAITHELTARLVRDFRWIGIEDLPIRGMMRTHLAKSVGDAAMAAV
jgi:putative transposase